MREGTAGGAGALQEMEEKCQRLSRTCEAEQC